MTMDPKAAVGGGRWMPFKNTASESIPAYGVVQFDGTELINGAIVWKVKKPAGDASAGNIAFNGPTTVAQNAFGACTYDAPCRALYSDGTDDDLAVGDDVGPEDDEWHMLKGGAGFVVLGGISTSGGYCLIGKGGADSGDLIGKADAFIAKGTSGNVSIWGGATPSTISETARTISAYSRMTFVDSGRWVHLTRFPSGWEISDREC